MVCAHLSAGEPALAQAMPDDECKAVELFNVCGEHLNWIESVSDSVIVFVPPTRKGVTRTETVRLIPKSDLFEKLPLKLKRQDYAMMQPYSRLLLEERALDLKFGVLADGSDWRCVHSTSVFCYAELAYVGDEQTTYLGAMIVDRGSSLAFFEVLIHIAPSKPAKDIHVVNWEAQELAKHVSFEK